MSNPLLENFQLPPFSAILPEYAEPAIDAILDDNRRRLAELLVAAKQPEWTPTWESLIAPLDEMEDRLSRAWSPIRHLNSVANSEAWRQAHDNCLEKLTAYHSELGQNVELYRAIAGLATAGAEGTSKIIVLAPAQRKALNDALRGFRLGGVDLPEAEKIRFKQIQQELSALSSRFEQNVLDATAGWSRHFTDAGELAGLPESALAMARQSARQQDKSGWLLTLQMPSYIATMAYADNRELRREVYEAYSTRASDQGPHAGRWDNSGLIEDILRLRHEEARLLGFNNYAELSLASKMAGTADKVLGFLYDLADRGVPKAREEVEELRKFAGDDLQDETLQAWDIAYYSEKLRIARYDISEEAVKPWFPAERVISGLFEIVWRLYGVTIQRNPDMETWHADVGFYDIHDTDGLLRGRFYLDLYARQHKRGGAWMDECVNRYKRGSAVQIPVAYLVCNLSPPVDNKSALFTHDEVTTLFHEFGHGLHHMLTRVDYPAVAGINGVEWDAVELPSQFMENWCWEQDALELISGHYETGEPLPAEMAERLRRARNFHAAMQMARQLEFSLFDFRLHLEYDPATGSRHREILQAVRECVAAVKPPENNRFQHSFAHIFSGGYAAGYYSYKWAEVLSADAFSKFEEEGIFNHETGRQFLENILERGGSEKALDLFVRFRGRQPDIEPLLRHSGLAA
jgi:oligopeptidase A